MNVKKSIVVRVRVAFLAVCLFAGAVVWKISQIQFVEGSHWREIAQESRFQYHKVPATRGNIYSDNESLLATSLPFYKLAMDPTICKPEVFESGIDSLALMLSAYFKDHSKEVYLRKIKNARLAGKQYIRLQSKFIDYQAKKEMMSWPIFREGKAKGGVLFEKQDKRFMPFGSLAKRTIGTINEDKVGAGLEFSFNQQLSGRDGEALYQRMSGNNWKPLASGNEIKPLQGFDIITTIDINLQDVAQDALYRTLAESDAAYGCVILMEVETGHIKAMANLGRKGPGTYVEDYNYAVGNHGRTEPGSTFKLATMMALMEDNPKLSLYDSVDCGNGKYRYRGGTMTDVKEGGYGWLPVQKVFEKSSNIGLSLLASKHFGQQPQRYIDYLYKFGLAHPLGFQMHGEARPYIKTTASKSWSAISLPWMSIGYELKLSPLQTLAYYNAIANDGKKIQPIIVKEIRKADQVLKRFHSQVLIPKICSDETLDKMRKLLEGVVENGTARNIKSPLYRIAGKTGTAQKIINGAYSKTYSASFCGYFPADRPKYSCIVIIDSPKSTKRYGGEIAAPVFKELADKVYARDTDLHKSRVEPRPLEERTLPVLTAGNQEELSELCKRLGISLHPGGEEEWVSVKTTNLSYEAMPRTVENGLVPDVRGMTLRDALYLLGNYGLKVHTQGSGRVATQSIEPGIKAQRGTRITITLS